MRGTRSIHRLAMFALALFACPAALAQADLVVRNAKIWTGGNDRPEALAVRGGKFTVIGSNADVALQIGPTTKVIEAGGKRVLPGLIDAHVHLGNAARSLSALDLRGASGREDLLARLEAFARDMPSGAWIVGTGWSAESWPDQRPPTAQEIQRAAGDRPAALIRMDGHSLLASDKALALAGITKEGPADPPGGKIARADDGAPTGAVIDEAMTLITAKVPAPAEEERRAALLRAIGLCNAAGLTAVGAIETRETAEALAALDREKPLTLRIAVTVWDEEAKTVDAWKPTLEWAAKHARLSPRIRVLGFKGYMDGSLGSRSAWMAAPYADDPANSGFPLAMASDGSLRELILLGASMGLQPAVHAIGDRANHVILEWYGELAPAVRAKVRPRIEHAQHLLPGDIGLFLTNNVIASMQPYHKADDGRYAEARLGPERVKTSYTFASLVNDGARVAFGSDWPVVSNSPFLGMWAAVCSRTLDGRTFVPEEALHIEDALHLYTSQAAWALQSEQSIGRIAQGLQADFVMLDRDIAEVPAEEIRDVRAVLTAVAGAVVFKAE